MRVGGDAVSTAAQLALPGRGAAQDSLRFLAKPDGSAGNDITIEIQDEPPAGGAEPSEGSEEGGEESGGDADAGRFRLTITPQAQSPEVFDNLSLRRGDERYAVDVINAEEGGSLYVTLEDLAPRGVSLANRLPEGASHALAGGAETLTALVPSDFQGDVAARVGIEGLEAVEDVTIIAVPDLMKAHEDGLLDEEGVIAVQKGAAGALREHGEPRRDPGHASGPRPAGPGGMVRQGQPHVGRRLRHDLLPLDQGRRPGVAGVALRTAQRARGRGVVAHRRSPRRAQGVCERGAAARDRHRDGADPDGALTRTELGALNVKSVNCIQAFPGRGIRVWAGRTLAGGASE